MNAPSFLALENIRFGFETKVVLDNLSLTVDKGQRLVILGKSGCGKSMLLRLLVGTRKPQAGSIRYAGADLAKLQGNALDKIRRKIGMVYQYSALLSSLNVRDNLALPLEELTRKSKQEIDQIVDAKLELVGLPEVRLAMPAELSGGMKKRVSLARALMMNPELILFDEPSAGLDPVASNSIDELIISLTATAGVTAIIATHELDSAFRIATRVAMLSDGKILAEDKPEVLRASQHPTVAAFLRGEEIK